VDHFGGRIREALAERFGGHSTISPLHAKWAMLVTGNTQSKFWERK
jgi:hypothetical protein